MAGAGPIAPLVVVFVLGGEKLAVCGRERINARACEVADV